MAVFPFPVAGWILLVGIYGLVTSRNLIHAIGCLSVAQSSTYVLLLAVGYRHGATAPVYADLPVGAPVVDPVVQALALTDVVVGVAVLSPDGLAGTALYVAGHAGAKAALFGLTGVLLDRYGSVDEHGLHGQARDLPVFGTLLALGGLALAGLPPFGTGLGKAVAEDAAGHQLPWLAGVFVLASAVTGGAVLRAALRVFAGAGPHPSERPGEPETTGEGEEPEIQGPSRRIPLPMLAVPGLLLLGCLLVGVLPMVGPCLAEAARLFTDRAGYAGSVLQLAFPPAELPPPAGWTGAGVLLGLGSSVLAVAAAAAAVWSPGGRRTARLNRRLVLPLRRLHSGLLGDYVSWLAVGVAVLSVALTVQTRV